MAKAKVYGKKKAKDPSSLLTLNTTNKIPEEDSNTDTHDNGINGNGFSTTSLISQTALLKNGGIDGTVEAIANLKLNEDFEQNSPSTCQTNDKKPLADPFQSLLVISGQKKPAPFSSWLRKWTRLCTVTKIGDGTYSNVYRMESKTDPSNLIVGKLIPLRPKSGKGSRTAHFTPPSQALDEVRMMESLAHVEGFAELRSTKILEGSMPKDLQTLSQAWDEEQHLKGRNCQDEAPKTYNFIDSQLWLFMEMDHAGRELEVIIQDGFEGDDPKKWHERGPRPLKGEDALDILYQVTRALANAEKALRFEHRDLHISNICIKRLPQARWLEGNGPLHRLSDLEVSIIDFTISRAEIDGEVLYQPMPLVDESIHWDIQTNTYVRQYKAADHAHPSHAEMDDFASFMPVTNLYWLYYLMWKLEKATPVSNTTEQDTQMRYEFYVYEDLTNPGIINAGGGEVHSAMDLLYYLENGKEEFQRAIRAEADLAKYRPEIYGDQGDIMKWLRKTREIKRGYRGVESDEWDWPPSKQHVGSSTRKR